MKILLVGDIHGYWVDFIELIEYASSKINIDAIIQVGDFGFYPGKIKDLQVRLEKINNKIPIYFIDGNHEDHLYLANANHEKLKQHNLIYLSRGSILNIDGRTLAFAGGALNVDRPQEEYNLKKGIIKNYICKDQIKSLADTFNQISIDILFTHACPGGIGIGIKGKESLIASAHQYISLAGCKVMPFNDNGEEALTLLYSALKVKPRRWVFGHYHQSLYAKQVSDTLFYCLECCDMRWGKQDLYYYDTKENDIQVILDR